MNAPPIAYVIAGIVLILALARYFPKTAGWVLLALVLGLLVVAAQKGMIGNAKS